MQISVSVPGLHLRASEQASASKRRAGRGQERRRAAAMRRRCLLAYQRQHPWHTQCTYVARRCSAGGGRLAPARCSGDRDTRRRRVRRDCGACGACGDTARAPLRRALCRSAPASAACTITWSFSRCRPPCPSAPLLLAPAGCAGDCCSGRLLRRQPPAVRRRRLLRRATRRLRHAPSPPRASLNCGTATPISQCLWRCTLMPRPSSPSLSVPHRPSSHNSPTSRYSPTSL